MGDGCGSGTGLDPYSIFYCASLSLYYFMFPAVLQATASSTPASSHTQTTAATGATQKRVRERGGGVESSGYQCTECRYQKTCQPPVTLFYFSL